MDGFAAQLGSGIMRAPRTCLVDMAASTRTVVAHRAAWGGSFRDVTIPEPPLGGHVAAGVEVHDVARVLEVVGPLEVE